MERNKEILQKSMLYFDVLLDTYMMSRVEIKYALING